VASATEATQRSRTRASRSTTGSRTPVARRLSQTGRVGKSLPNSAGTLLTGSAPAPRYFAHGALGEARRDGTPKFKNVFYHLKNTVPPVVSPGPSAQRCSPNPCARTGHYGVAHASRSCKEDSKLQTVREVTYELLRVSGLTTVFGNDDSPRRRSSRISHRISGTARKAEAEQVLPSEYWHDDTAPAKIVTGRVFELGNLAPARRRLIEYIRSAVRASLSRGTYHDSAARRCDRAREQVPWLGVGGIWLGFVPAR
jgi:hypothetical protein